MNDSPLASPEWLALVAAMRFAPDDDTPRLVGADWLTETGKPELAAWGEFIRYQCEGARQPVRNHLYFDSCDCTRCKCERKAVTIADRWVMHWRHRTWDSITVDAPIKMWVRGFVSQGIVPLIGPNLSHLARAIPPLFERQPMWGLKIKVSHTHPTRGTDQLTCDVVVEKSPMLSLANQVAVMVVKATLTRRDREHKSAQGVRWARRAQQFPSAVSAAVGEAIKQRATLNV